ncbi:MAG: ATPase, T2SS/T4P/T4SS family, partial [Planctomycetota bacterium]
GWGGGGGGAPCGGGGGGSPPPPAPRGGGGAAPPRPVPPPHRRGPPHDALQSLPSQLVFKQNCAPIAKHNGTLRIATSDPFELTVLDELRLLTGCNIDLALADEDDLRKFIRTHYGVAGDTLEELDDGATDTAVAGDDAGDDAGDELEQAQQAGVIKLVNEILVEAIRERATDVHIEPYEHELAVRYRIDGVLQRANVPARVHRFRAAIVSRLKIMASLNIAEKRQPQDGRISFRQRTPGRGVEEFDLRVSVIPMLFGEGVVLRVLNKTAVLLSLEDLGMPESVLSVWDRSISRPHGILLVTGPTGSGKSTTLYASLNRIVSDEIKAITVEDPVEYHVPRVNQIQVNTKVGLSFARGLRSILRHDPDVVMIGEIRDKETAETAIQASLTGHLVFSTLHTNDAPGAVTRLIDMGVEPFLVSSSVEAILAQRLVRRLCPDCRQETPPDSRDVPPGVTLTGDTYFSPVGCKNCRSTGYKGRIGVYELLQVDEEIRRLTVARAASGDLVAHGVEAGIYTQLLDAGLDLAALGVTSLQEVKRALAS